MGKEGQPIPQEQMGFFRKTADKAAGVNNFVDKATIGVGVIMLSAPVIAFGILTLWAGNHVRDNYIRKK